MLASFALVQLASEAFAASSAVDGTLPRRIPLHYAIAVYRILDRIAPAPYVEISLARQALQSGDADEAERYAVRLAGSPIRDELFAEIALWRGERVLANEYLLAAPDPNAIDASAQALASRDPASAYAMERLLEVRLAHDKIHPDAVAEAYWEMGRFANRSAWRQVPGSALQHAWLLRGLRDFETAIAFAPLSERYLVEAANQADLLGERARAQQLFDRAADIDPASADAVAGLGVVAWQNGDRRDALLYLMRARRLDSHALMVRALERDVSNRIPR